MSQVVSQAKPLSWYIFRCAPGKEMTLQQAIQVRHGVECFLPLEKVRQRDRHGRFVWVQRCVLSSYLFVHAERDTFIQIPKGFSNLRPMNQMKEGLWEPVIVPDVDMASFIRVSGSLDQKATYLDPGKLNFKKGDRVRVIGGSLLGVEGTFMQIGGKHEKRVVIQLENLIAVATAAIPASLVEKIG
jgi:transcription antitermination factor NusG